MWKSSAKNARFARNEAKWDFLSDFDILWLRFVTMAKLGHFEANIPISFVLVVHLLPRFPLPRYKSWLEWRIKKREQSKHCIHSSIRSKINFQLSVPTAKYKTNQIAQCWKIKEKVDFLSKRAKRALSVMEGCDKKSVCSEKRALKKALAQISVRSKKHALKKACAQESVRSEKRADSKCVFWR